MAIGSGLSGDFGLAAETTYGTNVVPSRFHEVNKAEIKKGKKTVQGGGLAAGRFAQLGSRRVVTSTDGGGVVEMEVANQKMGLLMQHIFGSTAAAVQQGGTAAYLQTYPLGSNQGMSLSAQTGIPDTTGTVRPYTFSGGKVIDATFACSVDQLLKVTPNFDFQSVTESQALAAPSYTTGILPFHFGQMQVKLGTFGSEAAVSGVKGVQLKFARPQKTDRYYAGAVSPASKAEPIMNNWVAVSGQIDADYLDKTVFADRFASDASTSLILQWTGPLIASTFYQQFTLAVPMIFFNGDTPVLAGPDVVSGSFPFVGQFDGTNALTTCSYMSIDTAA